MLTAKQEKFVQELIRNGGNRSAAYRVAYDASKMKEQTINQKASRLLKQDNIRARYDEIQGKVIEKTVEKTADDAATMRAFIIDKLKKIASGELTDVEEGIRPDGSWAVKKKTRRVSDIQNALRDLAAYYGCTPEESESSEIVIRYENGADKYGD